MKNYFQEPLYNLQGYVPGEQPNDKKKIIKLNTNENPYPPSPKIKKALGDILKKGLLKKYPNPVSKDLVLSIAKHHKVRPSMVLVTNGSDEGLALLFKAVLGKNSKIVMPYPTYSLYHVLADLQLNSVVVETVPLDNNLHFDFHALENSTGELLAFAHPNAPTGIQEKKSELLNLVKKFPGIVLSDEAYIDFAPRGTSLINSVFENENLVVSRTFSKSYSLAGLRVGYLIANESLVDLLYKLKDSYNLGMLEQLAAKVALEDTVYFEKVINKILKQRTKLKEELEKSGFEVFPSETNFLFVKPPIKIVPEELFLFLKENGIFIRYFKDEFCKNFLRITVGSKSENAKLMKIINKFLTTS
ncbi:MAG: histidinol-phosphate transaminase [Leptospiraceae bacterium]|nr:histidinol-phosphate transaminase [Leptospiraceae bacterium]